MRVGGNRNAGQEAMGRENAFYRDGPPLLYEVQASSIPPGARVQWLLDQGVDAIVLLFSLLQVIVDQPLGLDAIDARLSRFERNARARKEARHEDGRCTESSEVELQPDPSSFRGDGVEARRAIWGGREGRG